MIEIDTNKCVGCGQCIVEYGGLDLQDDHAKIIQQPKTKEELVAALQAVDSCPTNALQLV